MSCAGATTLIVGMEDTNNRPFEYLDEEGNLTGFHVEIVRAVTASLGWTVEFQRYPWKRALQMLANGKLQALTFVAKAPEREGFALFLADNALHVSHTTLYIKRERAGEIQYRPPLEAMLRRWQIGMPEGYYFNDEIAQLVKDGAPIAQASVTQTRLFSMLLKGRYDAIFGSTTAMERTKAESQELEQQIQRLDGALFSGKTMYIAFSRQPDAAALAPRFAAAYRTFRSTSNYMALARQFKVTELLPSVNDFK